MKYSEFKKLIENEGFKVYIKEERTEVIDSDGYMVGLVSNVETELFDNDYVSFSELPRKLRRFMVQKFMELAFTDLEDRKDKEEKYYLRQIGINSGLNFLNKNITTENNGFIVSTRFKDDSYQVEFTQSEIDQMPECYTHPAVWKKFKVGSEDW